MECGYATNLGGGSVDELTLALFNNREMAPAPSFFPIKNSHITLEIPLEAEILKG